MRHRHLLKSKDSLIFQRSRSKWLKKGDANSRFFHLSVKFRGARNRLSALKVGNGWVEKVSVIRAEITNFFRE